MAKVAEIDFDGSRYIAQNGERPWSLDVSDSDVLRFEVRAGDPVDRWRRRRAIGGMELAEHRPIGRVGGPGVDHEPVADAEGAAVGVHRPPRFSIVPCGRGRRSTGRGADGDRRALQAAGRLLRDHLLPS